PKAGKMLKPVVEYPSLEIGPLIDTHRTDIGAIMRESLETEAKALALYRELLKCAEGRSVILEEYARQMVYAEELHASEVDKMLRTPERWLPSDPIAHPRELALQRDSRREEQCRACVQGAPEMTVWPAESVANITPSRAGTIR